MQPANESSCDASLHIMCDDARYSFLAGYRYNGDPVHIYRSVESTSATVSLRRLPWFLGEYSLTPLCRTPKSGLLFSIAKLDCRFAIGLQYTMPRQTPEHRKDRRKDGEGER